MANYVEAVIGEYNCAQIVPVKVNYFQMVPNENKNTIKNWNRINCLELQ